MHHIVRVLAVVAALGFAATSSAHAFTDYRSPVRSSSGLRNGSCITCSATERAWFIPLRSDGPIKHGRRCED